MSEYLSPGPLILSGHVSKNNTEQEKIKRGKKNLEETER